MPFIPLKKATEPTQTSVLYWTGSFLGHERSQLCDLDSSDRHLGFKNYQTCRPSGAWEVRLKRRQPCEGESGTSDTGRYDEMTWCHSMALRGAKCIWGLSGVEEDRRPEEQVTHGSQHCLRLFPSNGSFKPLVATP